MRSAAGLTEAEASRRLALAGRPARQTTSRSYASIVRANVLTVFNLILAGFGVITLIFGDPHDALFLGIIVANSAIGIIQEVRAKRALDRLSLLVAPHANVRRDGDGPHDPGRAGGGRRPRAARARRSADRRRRRCCRRRSAARRIDPHR